MGEQKRHEPVPPERKKPETHPAERTDEAPMPEERMPERNEENQRDRTAHRQVHESERSAADGPGSSSGGGKK